VLRHYIALAGKVLRRRKFFTFVSLFGISFTLLVLMVVTAMLDHAFGPAAPETRQDRTLAVRYTLVYGPHTITVSSGGFKLFDQYARNLPGVERLSLFTTNFEAFSYIGGQKIQSSMKRTDAEFFQILDFTFVDGAPYSHDDVEQARFVAVINTTTRRRFFGSDRAVGQTLEAFDQRFRVVGVVEDVSEMRMIPFGDIWVPLTTARSDAYRGQLTTGNFNAIALATNRSALPGIREEFNSRLTRVELPDPQNSEAITAPFETAFEYFARKAAEIASRREIQRDPALARSQAWKTQLGLTVIGLLFVLLPTINLINLNVSRIMERASEIGVRKSFGASSRTLVGQFLVENVLLTLIGALIGFVLSLFVLRAFNESGIIRYAHFAVNLRVFGYGVLLALAFGCVSGVYPAWRMSRMHPVEALQGGRLR
jgi:putative ABC transport system permease protein